MASLNKGNIAHFAYHWLWGLCYHASPPSINISSHFEIWEKDPELVRLIEANQKKIDGYYLNFFYWLFNIKDYALNFHKLKAYSLFKKQGNMQGQEADEIRNSRRSQRTRGLNNYLNKAASALYNGVVGFFYPSSTIKPSSESTEIILYGLDSSSSALKREVNKVIQHLNDMIMINDQMQNCLLLLDTSVEAGETYSWSAIKKIYRQQLILYHPDKGLSTPI